MARIRQRLFPVCFALFLAAPAHAGGYVAPVIEMIIPAAPAAAPTPMICGQRPEICVLALLALLALLAQSDHETVAYPITPPPPPVIPPVKPPVCVEDCGPPVAPPLPPAPAPVPLPGALMASAGGLGLLSALARRKRREGRV